MVNKIIKKIIKWVFLLPLCLKFLFQYIQIKRVSDCRFEILLKDLQPFIFDATNETIYDRHYIYHTAWAARRLDGINPDIHHDFSSSLYFIAIVSSNHKINFYDFRKANLQLSNVQTYTADLTNLVNIRDGELSSVSCMHVLEHIGLGRYGDGIDPQGDLKAINELKRVVKIGGYLLIVIPIGAKAKIKFNANRIYTNSQIMEYFKDFELINSTLITDYDHQVHLINNPNKSDYVIQEHGCACYHFKKNK